MGEALRAGERGVEPPLARATASHTAATAFLDRDDVTEATRALSGGGEGTEATQMLPPRSRVEPRPPRRQEPAAPRQRRAAAPAAAPARPPASAGARLRRALGLILLILVLIAAGLAAIVYADSRSHNPRLHQGPFGQDVNSAVNDVKNLIDDNTR